MQDLTKMGDEELVEAYGNVREDILACDEAGDDKGLVLAQAKHKPLRAELLRRLKSAHIRSDSEVGCGEGAD